MKEKVIEKGITRRLFSVVLALAMVLTLMPMNSLTAHAESISNVTLIYNVGGQYWFGKDTNWDSVWYDVDDNLSGCTFSDRSNGEKLFCDGVKLENNASVSGKIVKIDGDKMYVCTASDHETNKAANDLCPNCDPDGSSTPSFCTVDSTKNHAQFIRHGDQGLGLEKVNYYTNGVLYEANATLLTEQFDPTDLASAQAGDWFISQYPATPAFIKCTGIHTLPAHVHTDNYGLATANTANDTLTWYCSADGCTSGAASDAPLKLTLKASSPNYVGSAATITIGTAAETAAWEAAGLTVPTDISYEKSDGTPLAAAPTDAGSYVAKVSPVGETATADNTAKVSFTIKLLDSSIITYPTAKKDLVYNEKAQELITAGSAEGGDMVYSLNSDDDEDFSASIPTATDAGTYKVYFKVVGDADHNDTIPDYITVNIEKADSVIVTAPKKVVTAYDGKEHELVIPGSVVGGEMVYSFDGLNYFAAVPTGTYGLYTVYYKVAGDANHNDTDFEYFRSIIVNFTKATSDMSGFKLDDGVNNMHPSDMEAVAAAFGYTPEKGDLVVLGSWPDGYTGYRWNGDSWDVDYYFSLDDLKKEIADGNGIYIVGVLLDPEHSADTSTYKYDENYHWNPCTIDNCDIAEHKYNKEAHVSSGPATVENAEVCTVCGYEIAPRLDPEPDPDPDPGHIHSYTYCTDGTGHWKVCACGDKIFVSAHSFGKGYKCACGYVDEARKKSIEEAAAIRDMAAALDSTATVICYADGKPVATCNSRKGKDSVKIKLGSDYAGKTFVIKLSGKIIAEGEFDSDGIYVFEDAALGLLYKLYID